MFLSCRVREIYHTPRLEGEVDRLTQAEGRDVLARVELEVLVRHGFLNG